MNEADKRGLGRVPSDKPRVETVTVNVTVNGKSERLTVEPRMTLLDALREELGLTGTKKGCDRGNAARARCTSRAGACSRA